VTSKETTMQTKLFIVLIIIITIQGIEVTGAAENSSQKAEAKLNWHDVSQWGVEGKGWTDTERYYDRLPSRAKGRVFEQEWSYAKHSTGMVARFETDSTAIYARWQLLRSGILYKKYGLSDPFQSASGVSGFNLYAKDDEGQWRSMAVGNSDNSDPTEVNLVKNLDPVMRQYMLYLPLSIGVESVEIGVDTTAIFKPIAPRTQKPIVFYGTSIVGGAYASRAGMCHAAILGRRLDRPVINLGMLCGQSSMIIPMAELLGELDPCVYVIDPLPNMIGSEVAERTEPFVQALRKARPDTPIVLVADRVHGDAPFKLYMQAEYDEKHKILRNAYNNLISSGVKGLYYVPGDNLFGDDGEGFVEGSHPNDLGFMRMADILEPVLKPLINQTSLQIENKSKEKKH
jgi:lysophospholipase L1-like esterase